MIDLPPLVTREWLAADAEGTADAVTGRALRPIGSFREVVLEEECSAPVLAQSIEPTASAGPGTHVATLATRGGDQRISLERAPSGAVASVPVAGEDSVALPESVPVPAAAYLGLWFGAAKKARLGIWGSDGAWVRELGTGVTYGGSQPGQPWRSWHHDSPTVVWIENGGGFPFPFPGGGPIGMADFGAGAYSSVAVSGAWTRALVYVFADGVAWLEGDANPPTGDSRSVLAGLDLSSPTVIATGVGTSFDHTDFQGAGIIDFNGEREGTVSFADSGSVPDLNARASFDDSGFVTGDPHDSQDQIGYAYPLNGANLGIGLNGSSQVSRWLRGLGPSDGFTARAPAFVADNIHLDEARENVLAYRASTGALKVGSSIALGNTWATEVTLAPVPVEVDAADPGPPAYAFFA